MRSSSTYATTDKATGAKGYTDAMDHVGPSTTLQHSLLGAAAAAKNRVRASRPDSTREGGGEPLSFQCWDAAASLAQVEAVEVDEATERKWWGEENLS